jgi:nucleotide-binding universal stress UspA family protein
MFKHILIPTDGSRASAKAIKAGIALAKQVHARVTGFYGVGAVPYAAYGEPMLVDRRSFARMERALFASGEAYLAQVGRAARAAGVPFEPVVARTAATYQGIVDVARKRKCDLIFMASHGRRGFKRILLGSVTQQVLAHSRIPVLVHR